MAHGWKLATDCVCGPLAGRLSLARSNADTIACLILPFPRGPLYFQKASSTSSVNRHFRSDIGETLVVDEKLRLVNTVSTALVLHLWCRHAGSRRPSPDERCWWCPLWPHRLPRPHSLRILHCGTPTLAPPSHWPGCSRPSPRRHTRFVPAASPPHSGCPFLPAHPRRRHQFPAAAAR